MPNSDSSTSFQQLITNRYSVRSYKSDKIEQEKLDYVLEAARMAPTAVNKQPFQFILIDTRKYKSKLSKIYSRDWFVQPPWVVCACAIPDRAWSRRDGKNYADVDTTIAMDHLILAATEMGLGTCWIAAFDVDAARTELELPDGWNPIAFTPLGYPADTPGIKKRKSIDEISGYFGAD